MSLSDLEWCWCTQAVFVTDTQALLPRLVEGVSLNRHLSEICLPGTVYEPSMQQHEQQVLEIAAQLLEVCHETKVLLLSLSYITQWYVLVVQTVHRLHRLGKLAHLDITSSNIMLRKEGYEAWDQLRLLDFGFSQFCNKGRPALLAQPTCAVPCWVLIIAVHTVSGTKQ